MSIVSLSDLLAGARPDTHCVALKDHRQITLARLRADVSHNAQRLSARCIRHGAVVCEDGYWFLVGLLALVKIGADVILPPNSRAGTLRGLAHELDVLLTDSGVGEVASRVALESSETEAAPMRFDVANSRIDFFTSGSTGEMKRVTKSLTLFEREAAVLEQMWGAELGDAPVFGTVTHQHVFGMTFRIMWPLLAGRPYHSEFHVAWEPLLALLNGPAMIVSSRGLYDPPSTHAFFTSLLASLTAFVTGWTFADCWWHSASALTRSHGAVMQLRDRDRPCRKREPFIRMS